MRRRLSSAIIATAVLTSGFALVAQQAFVPQPPRAEGPRDPYTDPTSPVRDPNRDPGHRLDGDRDLSGFGVAIKHLEGDWPWGEMFYDRKYPTKLKIKNECPTTETVSIFVTGLPYIWFQRLVAVPGNSEIELPATVETPPEPKIVLTGNERLGHGIYVDVKGSVVVWHPFRPGNPACHARRDQYNVTGHIHFDTKKAPKPTPEKIASPDPCQVWWNTGEKPAAAADRDCTETIRSLAADYRARVLQWYADHMPDAWKWLPSVADIGSMSIDALLAMKRRADDVIRGGVL